MKHKIIIQRSKYYKAIKQPDGTIEDVTIGNLSIVNSAGVVVWRCYTLENGGESTDTPNQDKRIVARNYTLQWSSSNMNRALARKYPAWAKESALGKELVTDSTHGEAIVLWVTTNEVEGFNKRRILIHIGNTAKDTKGCILLGNVNNNNGTIGQSVDCVKTFFEKIKEIGVKNTTLTIKEI